MNVERGSEVEVRIRPFQPDDAVQVHAWFNNPEIINSLMEVRESFSVEQAEGWVARAIEHDTEDGPDRKYAILVEGRETPIGFTALYQLKGQLAPELGVLVGETVRAKGIGREAERLTCVENFEVWGQHRVYGRIPAFNIPAKKAVAWMGWKHEGTMRDHIRRPDGTMHDLEIWGATREDWEERWGPLPA